MTENIDRNGGKQDLLANLNLTVDITSLVLMMTF